MFKEVTRLNCLDSPMPEVSAPEDEAFFILTTLYPRMVGGCRRYYLFIETPLLQCKEP